MKRDVDLSRAILAFIEEHSPAQGGLDKPLEIEGYDRPTVLAHAQLLIDDGLVDGKVLEALAGPVDVVIRRLTSSGHDAIAAAKNDTAWQKAKKLATERGIPLTLSVLVQIVKAEARKHLGLP
jgi:hypothetical protein